MLRLAFQALFALSLGGALLPLSACSTSENGSACAAEDTACKSDGECCTKNCAIQGTVAVCRAPGVGTTICATGGAACTQNRHCCDGLCEDGKCFGNGGPTQPRCQPNGASCTDVSSCCSAACGADGKCAAAASGGLRADGGACEPGGSACLVATDCCSGVCFPSPTSDGNICSGTTGGGGGGSNCVASGRQCSSNFDCCSRSCQPRAGGGSYCS